MKSTSSGYPSRLRLAALALASGALAVSALAFGADGAAAQVPPPAGSPQVKQPTPTPEPFSLAGEWTGTATLQDVVVTADVEIPDPFDPTKPPQKITKEECEKQAEETKGKPQSLAMEFSPTSPTSGTLKSGEMSALPYRFSRDTLTVEIVEPGQGALQMEGRVTVEGDRFVLSGTQVLTMGQVFKATSTFSVSRPRNNQAPPIQPTAAPPTAAPTSPPTATPRPSPTPRRDPTAAPTAARTAAPTSAPGTPAPTAPAGTAAPSSTPGTRQAATGVTAAGKDPLGKTPPGMNGVGKIPGPDGATQAAAGALIPGVVSVLGSLIAGLGGRPPAAPETPPPPGPPAPEGPKGNGREARRRELQDAANKAQQEAATAANTTGAIAGEAMDSASKEISDLWDKTKGLGSWLWGATKQTAKDAYEGAKEVAANPEIIKDTLTGSLGTVRDGFVKAASAASSAAGALWDKAREAWKDPEAAARALASALKGGYESTIAAIGSGLKSAKEFLTDPSKVWETVKDMTGISNFGNALDPNRSLAERLGQVGLGVGKLYISIVTAGQAATAMKAGTTMVLERTGLRAAGSEIMGGTAARTAGRASAAGVERVAGGEALHASHGGRGLVSAGENVIADTRGIPKSQLDAITDIANKRGVQIGIRPTTPDARAWLESGKAIPKPEGLYNKSINAVDEMLGAPAGRRGLIGSFEPKLPPMPQDPKLRAQVMDRYLERLKEWKTMQPHQGRFKVIDGVVHDAASGKPLVSDIDLAGVFKDGKAVPEDVGRMIIGEIRKKCPGVVHGDVNSWYATAGKQAGIMDKIIGAHTQAGGNAIVVAGPNGVGAGFLK